TAVPLLAENPPEPAGPCLPCFPPDQGSPSSPEFPPAPTPGPMYGSAYPPRPLRHKRGTALPLAVPPVVPICELRTPVAASEGTRHAAHEICPAGRFPPLIGTHWQTWPPPEPESCLPRRRQQHPADPIFRTAFARLHSLLPIRARRLRNRSLPLPAHEAPLWHHPPSHGSG